MRIARSNSRSTGPRGRLLATALASAVVLLPGLSHAQQVNVVQRSFINLSFELPNLQTAGCRVYINEALVPGWTTNHPAANQENVGNCVAPPGFSTAPAPILELWRTPRQTVSARSGNQLAELNAVVESRISQSVCLEPQDQVRWQFSHRGRASATRQDQMEFLVGTTPIVSVGTTNDGTGGVLQTPLGTSSSTPAPGATGWRDYSGSFVYTGTRGTTNIGFRAIPVVGGSPTEGNFLDDIQVFLRPFIELSGGTYQTPEGTSTGLPALRIAGTLDNPLDVTVTVNGGTAVLGTDFTTPSGTSTFTVRVPAAAHEGTIIPLGLQAPANTTFDGTRSVQLRLEANDSQYFTRSTSVCGNDGATNATWTILDDDIDLSVVKSVSPTNARTGQEVTYTLTVLNDANARVSADNAVIRDPAVTGLDCSAAVPTCTATAGAACPVDTSIAALQSNAGVTVPVLPPGGQVQLQFACRVTASGAP